MVCKYRKTVPGDCHIQCTAGFKEGDMVPYNFVKTIRDLPTHAGIYPLLFNEYFICYACPKKDEV